MHYLDILIGLTLAGGLARGFSTGVIRQVATFAGLLIAFALSVQLMDPVGQAVAASIGASTTVAPLLGFVLIFLVVQIVVFAVSRLAETLVGALKLTILNRLAGGVVGAFKAALLLSVAFLVLGHFGMPAPESRHASVLYGPVAGVLPQTWNYAAEHLPQVRRLADRFTAHLQEQWPETGH